MTRAMPTTSALALAAFAMLAGCGDNVAIPGVLERSDPASAADCPNGGTVISSGRDADADGVLEDSEVAVRTAVCQPAPLVVAQIVIRIAFEPPGPHCSAGGTAVASGADGNGNGVLDNAEVAHVDYLCRQAVVTRLAAEPAGANCLEGGVAFLVGTDRDGDGELDDAEIEHTDFACGDIVTRDVVVHSAAEAAAIAPIRVITGGLTVQLTTLQTLSLPQLERIGGSLHVLDNARLTQLSLPALQAVDGDIALTSSALTSVECPQLVRAAGLDLELLSLPRVTGFPLLATIDGAFQVHNMPSLAALQLAQATRVGDVSITANPALAHFAWDVTDEIGAVDIHGNAKLQTVDLSVNTFFGGPATIGPIAVTANPLLGHLALQGREIASFTIGGEPVLTDIQFPPITVDHDVTIVDVTAPFNLMMRGHFGRMEIDGNLTISGPVATFEAGDGFDIRGNFVLDGTSLETIARFPDSIRVIQRLVVSNNPRLEDLSAFAILGDLEVTHNTRLSSLNPELLLGSEMGGLVLIDNPRLFFAPALASAARFDGGIDIERNPLLVTPFGAGPSRIAGPVRIRDNENLAAVELSQLTGVLSSLDVSSNPALQTLVLPALPEVAGPFTIADNAQLHHIDLTALTHSDDFHVDNNPRLPTCEVLAVFGHTSGAHEQSGNDDNASCGP